MLSQEVKNVGGGQMVKGFASEEKVFVLNAEVYWEPVELDKNEGDMVR